ncbi:hypothetical protein MRB53_040577 [Persea americana]|nr:hypothetical protein MRB53_040577 [Persea americana]
MLSSAVAGLESRLDTILADGPEAAAAAKAAATDEKKTSTDTSSKAPVTSSLAAATANNRSRSDSIQGDVKKEEAVKENITDNATISTPEVVVEKHVDGAVSDSKPAEDGEQSEEKEEDCAEHASFIISADQPCQTICRLWSTITGDQWIRKMLSLHGRQLMRYRMAALFFRQSKPKQN